MKKILFILFLIIPFIGFGQNDTVTYYHENGQLHNIGILKDGKKEGLWKYYYQDGFLEKSVNYKNGLFHGLWTNYRRYTKIENRKYKRSEVDESILEVDESMYVNGRRKGVWKFYRNNKLIKEGYLENKMRQRIWKYYHDNGQLKKETKWKDDEEIYSRYWDENGNEIDKEIYYETWGVNGNRVDKLKY